MNYLEDNEPIFTIGIAAKKLGVSVPTLRMYEHAGLILPYRNKTGRRIYSIADLMRIGFIRRLIKEEGLNLAGIRRLIALLPCWNLKPCSPSSMKNCPAYLDCKKICWMVPETTCRDSQDQCRTCPVYLHTCDSVDHLKDVFENLRE
ncbi:MAG: MerR family transcriptional regulator [Calditrichaeota bacterium]|nr:MerR family transcriptional regulator [Calditrichota bacterium]